MSCSHRAASTGLNSKCCLSANTRRAAVRNWVKQVQSWPVQRVILLHNSVIDDQPVKRLREALSIWD